MSAAGRGLEAPWRIETALGEFEIDERDVVHFAEGLPGFEENRRFVLLSSDAAAPLHALHAVDGPPASFVVVDPRLVLPDYRTALGQSDRARLGAADEASLVWLALVTVDGQLGATVNLRAPIVINPARMIGFQVLPHNSLYPLRHPLGAE